MTTYQVGYFIGSLSSTSINRLLSKALIKLAPKELTFTEIPFADLPLYRPEFDADFPPPAKAFKQAVAAVDAVLFVTPEYNRSIPGGLKNAIDFASRDRLLALLLALADDPDLALALGDERGSGDMARKPNAGTRGDV